jgi:hypothetical protein
MMPHLLLKIEEATVDVLRSDVNINDFLIGLLGGFV